MLDAVTTTCTDLLGVDGTGVLLVDPGGGAELRTASSEQAGLVKLLQTRTGQGPWWECLQDGEIVTAPTWPARSSGGRGSRRSPWWWASTRWRPSRCA